MDRYTQFGLRGDADEQIRRAVRDGFKRAGLSGAQLTQAMEWYKDRVRPGMDEAKLMESFAEFAAGKNWPDAQRDAAVSVYGAVRDQGYSTVRAERAAGQARRGRRRGAAADLIHPAGRRYVIEINRRRPAVMIILSWPFALLNRTGF
jgi:hypothetical protein